MKFLRIVNIICLIIFVSVSVNGQTRKNVISFNAGAPVPIAQGELLNKWDPYFDFGSGFEHRINKNISLGVIGKISIFNLQGTKSDDIGNFFQQNTYSHSFEEKATVLSLMYNLKFYSGKKFSIFSPYLTYGTGVFHFRHNRVVDDLYTLEKIEDTSVGIKTGIGFNLLLNKNKDPYNISGLFMEINYIVGFTKYEKTSYIPVTIGFRISR